MKTLHPIVVIAALFLSAGSVQAQNMYKPSAYEISTLPLWAKAMYEEHPNLFKVDSLYNDYFSKHPFVKSYHTQYYKRWRRNVILYCDASGNKIGRAHV